MREKNKFDVKNVLFVLTITLFAVLIYELFGPLFTKWALTKAGDIQPMPEYVKNRRQMKLEHAKARKNDMQK